MKVCIPSISLVLCQLYLTESGQINTSSENIWPIDCALVVRSLEYLLLVWSYLSCSWFPNVSGES